MPSAQELIGLLVVIFVIWLVLKMAKVAIKLIAFTVFLLLFLGAMYWIFVR